jgi:hypothetical protein
MTEKLVTLETAKMLRTKGFNEYCKNVIDINNIPRETIYRTNNELPKQCFSQPTQSIAQKWLCEIKNLHIEIYRNACGYGYIIVKANNGTWMKDDDAKGPNDGGNWDTYEEALEEGLQEALKLI